MFRALANLYSGGAEALVRLHPVQLMSLMELVWNSRVNNATDASGNNIEFGHPDRRSDLDGLPSDWLQAMLPPPPTAGSSATFTLPKPWPASWTRAVGKNYFGALGGSLPQGSTRWDHLIYAYMIENTRIYEVFRRVLHELFHGEKLGVASPAAQDWLRNTEELFYRDPPPFSISAINSHVRSDLRATRRNAYQRMLGMDLNHGTDDGKPYPYVRADAANTEFVSTFEELLREVWVGMTHFGATAAPNPTDDAKIANLAQKLYDMLRSRRQDGALSREEFVFVSMMSWFHLSVESDLPIVRDLRAIAASPEQRLFKIAQGVGLPAHGHSKSYFDIATPLSEFLTQVESATYNDPAAVSALYSRPSATEAAMRTIITHWSIITGRDVKSRKVATT